MKDIAIGCSALLLGLIVGIVLTLGVNLLLASGAPNPVALPPAAPSASDVSLTMSAAFVNTQAQQVVRQSGYARQATITLASPNLARLALVVDVSVLGQTFALDVLATTRVAVQKGRVVLTVEKIDVGGVNVPSALIASTVEKMRLQVEEQINRAVQSSVQGTSLRLIGVSITSSNITLQFKSGS